MLLRHLISFFLSVHLFHADIRHSLTFSGDGFEVENDLFLFE